jgi:iron complex outermembrane receptor protein
MILKPDLARAGVAALAIIALRTGADVVQAATPDGTASPADAVALADAVTSADAVAPADAVAADAGAASPDSAGALSGELGSLSEVIVTGTRVGGIKAADSPAPIIVVGGDELRKAGAPDLMTSLSMVVPGFVKQAFGGDMANQTLQAKLRGLSPNHTLIMVDGKRRHGTANLAVLGGPYQGGAGPDLNFIPMDAVDHVEVLLEGAAAQYGSDAIAGVINIILKKDSSGGTLKALRGGYMDGGGDTNDGSAHFGFAPTDDSFFNVTAEIQNHAHSMRGGIDPRVVDPAKLATYPNSNMPLRSGYPYLNLIQGDAHFTLATVAFNSGFKLGDSAEFYSFGTWGDKKADSFENYRLPSKIAHKDATTGVMSYMYPYGFNPEEATSEKDYQITAGIKGSIAEWNWDLATGYGNDTADLSTIHSGNADLYAATGASPTDFYDGKFVATQWVSTLDINKNFDIGMAGPLNIAFGGEYRRDSYAIYAGDAASYYGGGAQSFPGFAPADAGKYSRKNYAAYIDLAATPIDGLKIDLAGRHEHFDDFGNTNIGKATVRYDITPAFAVRSTVSTGFRAPTLAEEHYTTVNVGPGTAFIQIQPNSVAATKLGLSGGLQPEKSTSFSFGVVLQPIEKLFASLDVYQIQVTNRIVGSGSLTGSITDSTTGITTIISQAVVDAAVASGASIDQVRNTGINLFANGIDTRTRGAEFTLSYPTDLPVGHVDWSASAAFNQTTVTKPGGVPLPAGSPGVGELPLVTGQALFDATALSDVTTASPKYVINLGMSWTYEKVSARLSEVIYGSSSEWENDGFDTNGNNAVYYQDKIGVIPTTNLELGYELMKGLTLNAGAVNLFNRYPPHQNSDLLGVQRAAGDNGAVTIYPGFSPFGINGGFYYARATFSF